VLPITSEKTTNCPIHTGPSASRILGQFLDLRILGHQLVKLLVLHLQPAIVEPESDVLGPLLLED